MRSELPVEIDERIVTERLDEEGFALRTQGPSQHRIGPIKVEVMEDRASANDIKVMILKRQFLRVHLEEFQVLDGLGPSLRPRQLDGDIRDVNSRNDRSLSGQVEGHTPRTASILEHPASP